MSEQVGVWKYACPYCLAGFVPIRSSVTEAMIHPDSPVGRILCEGRDKPTVLFPPRMEILEALLAEGVGILWGFNPKDYPRTCAWRERAKAALLTSPVAPPPRIIEEETGPRIPSIMSAITPPAKETK